jgi:uncharacterized membrane protein
MNSAVLMKDSNVRSFVKGVSWRVTGTIDTMVVAYFVTGNISNAVKIGLTEVLTKIFLYYLHERLWNVIKFGRIQGVGPTHARSLVKGISWRAVGTMDTMIVAYFITGIPLNALKIGGFEVFTKIGLYYVHERIWGKFKWGREFIATPFDGDAPLDQHVRVQTDNVTVPSPKESNTVKEVIR